MSPNRLLGPSDLLRALSCILLPIPVLLTLTLLATTACNHRHRGRGIEVTGQVLSLEGQPITDALIRAVDESVSTRTDARGRFVLRGLDSGPRAIVVDLREAAPGGTFQMRMNLPEPIDGAVRMPAPMHVPVDVVDEQRVVHGLSEQTIVSSRHPGASLTIQRGSVRDRNGVVLDPPPVMSLLYIPPHLLPGAMPGDQVSSVIFSGQPSGLLVDPPARITFPNYDGFAPGESVPLMAMNPETGEWEQIGTATVDPSGTSIVSDPGSGIRWTSCTGCCYPPCYAEIGGRVTREVVRGQGTAEEPVADALVTGPGGRNARTDADGRYRLDRVPLQRARFNGGSQSVTLTAQFDPEGDVGPMQKTEERTIACDSSAEVDFKFDGIVLSLYDDQNDLQDGGPRGGGVVDTVTADGDASARERGTHVQVKLAIASPPDGLQVRLALSTPDGGVAGDLGALAVDTHPRDGVVDGPSSSQTELIEFAALRQDQVKVRWFAPTDFGTAEDLRPDGRERRRVQLRAEGYVNGELVLASFTPLIADVVRPQVLFLHGWGGDAGSFKSDFAREFARTLGTARVTRRASPPFLDYEIVHSSTMEVIRAVVAPQLTTFDARLLSEDHIASTRYDVAAHSYGGLNARNLIREFAEVGPIVRIRSLATLGTPHLGAELADRGLNLAQDPAVPGGADDLGFLRGVGGRFLSERTMQDLGASATRMGGWHELSTLVRMREEAANVGMPPLPQDVADHLLPLGFGFVDGVRYRLFRSAASGFLDRKKGEVVDWASGCKSRAGDGIVPTASATAGVESPALREDLAGSIFHTDLTANAAVAQRVRAFFAGSDPTAVPVPNLDASRPILRWMDRVEASDLPGHSSTVVFRGSGLRGTQSTQIRFTIASGPRDITLLPNQVTANEVRYDFRQWMATPEPRDRMRSGYVYVLVDGVVSDGLYLEFVGENQSRPRVRDRGPGPEGVLSRAFDVDHDDPVLHDPVVLIGDQLLIPRVISTQPAGTGFTSVIAIELPSQVVSGELSVAEGLRQPSDPIPFGVTPVVTDLDPQSTCVGMEVTVSGAWFGSDPMSVRVTVGGVVQHLRSVAPDAIRFVVADGTATGTLRVEVAGAVAQQQPTLDLGTDADFDGMPDTYERAEGLDPNDPRDALLDLDADLVSNREEYQRGIRASLADTDGGGLDDGEEIRLGLDPRNPIDDDGDGDGDGLSRSEELALGTDPLRFDTDGDQLGDGTEVRGSIRGIVTDPLEPDTDHDGLVDGEELLGAGTDPRLADTDGDARLDGDELHGLDGAPTSDPLDRDTDDDGLEDGAEVSIHHTNPRLRDTDGDGLDDRDEIQRGTDPRQQDSDGDRLGDGLEVAAGSDPLLAGPSTTVRGRTLFADNAAAAGATVSVARVPIALFVTSSGIDGGFAFEALFPSDVAPIVVTASARDATGAVRVGRSAAIPLVSGSTDVGTIRLDLQRGLIVSGLTRSSEPANTQVMTTYFQAGLTALAIESDVVDEVPATIDPGYSLVCDLRFSNVFGLPPSERTTFANWLALGRTLIIHGENSSFPSRNFAVQDWLVELGGGFVRVASQNGPQSQACVHPTICSTPNQIASVAFNAPGMITDPGLGSRITAQSIAVWDAGQLTQSPTARVVLCMDINMWTGSLAAGNRPFFDNLVWFATR